MNPTGNEFLKLGNIYAKSVFTESNNIALRRFKSHFGVSPKVCSIVWADLKNDLPDGSQPKHLLWCLSFLKQYATEHQRRFECGKSLVSIVVCIRRTCAVCMFQIVWEKRFEGAVNGQTCFTSLDGVDFPIMEPAPFNPGWYSHKFNGAGLRYEIGLNIRTGNIDWANGGYPYPCGLFSDLKLARESYIHSVDAGERTMADKVYKDQIFFILPTDENRNLHKLIMARHETVNKIFKQFRILKQEFRNSLSKHPMVFHAVANLTQIKLQNGEPLFSVNI